jgi:hypothetical protein
MQKKKKKKKNLRDNNKNTCFKPPSFGVIFLYAVIEAWGRGML